LTQDSLLCSMCQLITLASLAERFFLQVPIVIKVVCRICNCHPMILNHEVVSSSTPSRSPEGLESKLDLNLDEMASKLKYSLDSVLSGSSSLNMSGTPNTPGPTFTERKDHQDEGKELT